MEIMDLLATQPFLAELTAPEYDALGHWANRVVFHPGTRVFNEGGHADRFWLIREGEVELDTEVPGHGRVVIERLGPGAVLGWSWMFPPYQWRFGAVARTPTLAITFDANGIRKLIQADPVLGRKLMSAFAGVVIDRLQHTRARLLDLERAHA